MLTSQSMIAVLMAWMGFVTVVLFILVIHFIITLRRRRVKHNDPTTSLADTVITIPPHHTARQRSIQSLANLPHQPWMTYLRSESFCDVTLSAISTEDIASSVSGSVKDENKCNTLQSILSRSKDNLVSDYDSALTAERY